MDQHGLKPADLVPLLGSASGFRIMRGKKLTLAMVQRLRARFGVPADLLLPPVRKAAARRRGKGKAA